MHTNTNGTMDKCPDYPSVLISEVPDFRGLNVCTLIQMGPWTSVLLVNDVSVTTRHYIILYLLQAVLTRRGSVQCVARKYWMCQVIVNQQHNN